MDKSLYLDYSNLLPIPGEAFFYPEFFEKEESDQYFTDLTTNIDWKQEPVQVFGKQVLLPRFIAFYGDEGVSYNYLGVTMEALPWTDVLQRIKQHIEVKFDVEFNSCTLSHYRNGADHVGWHRDNSKNLGQYPFIASVSFGASRIFQFRHYEDKRFFVSFGENRHYIRQLQLLKLSKSHSKSYCVLFPNIYVKPSPKVTKNQIRFPSFRWN